MGRGRRNQNDQEGDAKTSTTKRTKTSEPRRASETTEAVEEATAATAASATTRAWEGAHQDIPLASIGVQVGTRTSFAKSPRHWPLSATSNSATDIHDTCNGLRLIQGT